MINEPLAIFQWLSPLGISVFLFLLQSVLMIVACFIIFAMGPQITTVHEREHGGFLLSGRMDSLFFGKSIRQLVDDNPQLIEIDRYSLYIRAGTWLAFGIFQVSLAWFGMRQGQVWAFWVIILGNIAALAGWIMVLRPFVQKGIPLGMDMPPVVLILASVLVPVAAIFGWIGLY